MSGITLTEVANSTIPTPASGKATLFNSTDEGSLAQKDDAGTVTSLKGADGDPAPALTYEDHGNTGSTETVDASNADVHRLVANAATVTLTLTGAPASGTPCVIRLWLEQDGSGGRDWAFPGSVDFGDPGEPDWTTRSGGEVDLVDLMTVDGGTTWIATLAGRAGPTGPAGADGADGTGSGTLTTVEEADGSPTDSAVTKLVFPNGTLGIASHVATYTPAVNPDLLPWTISITPYHYKATTGFTVVSLSTSDLYGGHLESGGAQNNEITWDVVLAAGTWTVEIYCVKGTDRGIMTVQFDGVSKGTMDQYNGTLQRNQKMSVTGITVATTAKIELKLIMATKNASSSSYFGSLYTLQLRRTA